VEKDLDKAKDYLSKAAAAGSPTAEEELKALNESIPAGTRAE
jgi:TPR repeat protein